MKPQDKERLVKSRPQMVRSLDVTQILPPLRSANMFTKKDEQFILSDNRRRERVIRFLDLLEKKKTEVYEKFQEILGDVYPQLLLSLTDWEDEGDGPLPCNAQLDDDWTMLQRARQYLIHEIDAAQIVKYMRDHNALSEDEIRTIMAEPNVQTRTEVFLDMLELHKPEDYDTFVEAVGETYPHVYLTLTGEADDRSDDDEDW